MPSIVTAVTAVEVDAPRATPRAAWRLTLGRFLSERAAVASLVAFGFVLFASFAGGPIVSAVVGHNGFDQFPYATNATLDPAGVWSHVPTTQQVRLDEYSNVLPPPKGSPTTLMVLGADGPLGRDEFIRVLDGGKASIEVGVFAVLISRLDRRAARLPGRVLQRQGRRDHLAADGVGDGVPADLLPGVRDRPPDTDRCGRSAGATTSRPACRWWRS